MPRLAGQQNVVTAANCSSANIAPALVSRENVLVEGTEPSAQDSVRVSGRAGPLRPQENKVHVAGRLTAITTASSSGLGPFGSSQHRQSLHGKPALPASSFPHSCQGYVDLLPVRQTLGDAARSSSLLSQLAVFGLVSLLLIAGLTSLLQLQPPLLAHLPSSSLVILSLLSSTTWHRSVLDTAKSIPSGTSSSRRHRQSLARTASAGLACVSLPCF